MSYLDRYGVRGVGEIDITRPRWSERPSLLVPLLVGAIANEEPGAGKRRFERGRQEAWEKERDLLARLRELPDGAAKADEVKQKIDRVRTYIGYREYPKYGMVSRYFVYKAALLAEATASSGPASSTTERTSFFSGSKSSRTWSGPTGRMAISSRDARRPSSLIEPSPHRGSSPPTARSCPDPMNASMPRPAPWSAYPSRPGPSRDELDVYLSVADAEFEPGDILVTVYTDPGWTRPF